MRIAYLLGVSIAVLVYIVIVVALVVLSVKSAQRRKALEQIREQIREKYESELALVRYVQLNRQCSEEVAYQRLAAFVKNHVPLDDYSSIDRMLAHDRQSLLETAQDLLVDDPDEIDKI